MLLTEGYMDAIACHQAGVEEAVAVLGTALSEEHAKQLKRYCEKVLLVFDADQAGLRAALRGAEILLKAGLEPRVVRLGGFKDPDEFLKAKGREAFEAELAQAGDALDFFADGFFRLAQASSPSGNLSLRERAQVMTQLFPLLERYATAMEAEVQLRRAAERLGLPLEAAKEDFERYRTAPKALPLASQPALSEPPSAVRAAASEASEAVERIEEELLALLVSHPDLQATAIEDLPEPLFASEELRAAAEILWKQPGRPLMELFDDGSEAFRLGESLLSRLALGNSERFNAPEASLRDLLLRRQLRLLEERAAQVQRHLDARPPEEKEMELLKEKRELNVEIQQLKQG